MSDILLIEDSRVQAVTYKRLLQQAGHSVRHAASADEAFQLCLRATPDLVVLDQYLGDKSGLEVWRRLKGDMTLQIIPILVLTGSQKERDHIAALDAGADQFLSKESSDEQLLAVIAGLLKTAFPIETVERDADARDAFMRGGRLLAIDDSGTYLNELAKKLSESGFHVTTATSGPEGLGLLMKESFHIAIIDVVMPEMDGFEVCRRTREWADSSQKQLGLLILSGQENRKVLLQSLESGADDFVSKTQDMEVILAHINSLIRRVRMMRHIQSINQKAIQQDLALREAELQRHQAEVQAKSAEARAALYEELEKVAVELKRSKGDSGRLRQIIVNLAGNSIKFTERGEVVVGVAKEFVSNGHLDLHFTVRDTGIGIPLEKQAKIFGAFDQADSSTSRRFGGTGLGLAISKQLVNMMGGRIWVESEENRGTTFHFTARRGLANEGRPKAIAAPTEVDGIAVLVVDDNATNRLIMQETLRSWNMKPTLAESGQAGLAKMQRAEEAGKPFQLILLDYMMPEMNGLDFARRVRDMPDGGIPKMIMLSSAAITDEVGRFRQLNIARRLTKPIKQSDLLNAVLAVLGIYAPDACATRATKPVHAEELYRAVEEIVSAEPRHPLTASVALQPDDREPRPDVATSTGEVLDWDTAVERMRGREDQLQELGELFLVEGPKMMDNIRDAVVNRDSSKSLERAAHTLKGSADIFAAQRVVRTASRLENIGRQGLFDEAEAAMANLEVEFPLLIQKLTEHCAMGFELPNLQPVRCG